MDVKELYINFCDLRAEVLAADFIDEGILPDNITIQPVGTFRRTFGRDVLSADLNTEHLASNTTLSVLTSREGIYDMLPEGLFHQPDPSKKGFKINDIVEGIRKTKKEEEDARRFFLAIEKEFYRLRFLIEYEERKAIDGYSDHFQHELFFRIWEDLEGLKEHYIPSLLQILPRAYRIAGDVALTQYVMSKTLGEKIEIAISNEAWLDVSSVHKTKVGEGILGVDAFCGDVMLDESPVAFLKIGPLRYHRINDFLKGGEALKVVDVLCNYLLPMETEVRIELKLTVDQERLILTNEPDDAILGFSSRI
ncbi:MAG: type VI secretion system baseplate subunit TssG [Crocinitomicaceae bacterium]|nr:type VI secretion system baseplate subunit TssG [Crocinitomicaceae bacterium]